MGNLLIYSAAEIFCIWPRQAYSVSVAVGIASVCDCGQYQVGCSKISVHHPTKIAPLDSRVGSAERPEKAPP